MASPTTPTRTRTQIGYTAVPQRILPPTQWREEEPIHRVVSPSHLSSDNIQKLVEEPYYVRGRSRETLFSNDATTPSKTYAVEKGKGEDRPLSRASQGQNQFQMEVQAPLSEKNVNLWSSLPENTPSSKQGSFIKMNFML